MEKLYELAEENDFDLIVVDTPPTRNALDFLDAPSRLSRFLDHRLYKMLTASNRGVLKAVNLATQTLIRSIARVVGADVIDDVVAFFQAFEGMEQGFRDRAARVRQLLAHADTAFVLVAAPRTDTVEEARFFADRLDDAGIPVETLVLNRMHPQFGTSLSDADRQRAASLAGTPLAGFYDNLADFRTIAEAEELAVEPLVADVAPAPVVRVPFLDDDVHDLGGLDRVAEHLLA